MKQKLVQTGWYETPQIKGGKMIHYVPRWRRIWIKEIKQIERMRKGQGKR